MNVKAVRGAVLLFAARRWMGSVTRRSSPREREAVGCRGGGTGAVLGVAGQLIYRYIASSYGAFSSYRVDKKMVLPVMRRSSAIV